MPSVLKHPTRRAFARVWTDIEKLEPQTVEQITHIMEMPGNPQVAIMPDAHLGKGACIGAVVGLEDLVCPNIVGVDIGCGMSAVRLDLKAKDLDREFWREWRDQVRWKVPVGFNKHTKPVDRFVGSVVNPRLMADDEVIQHLQLVLAPLQMGTLGGGNHFMEAQYDEDDNVWLMVHSGSRQMGLRIANHYNKLAQAFNIRWRTQVPADLWVLPTDDQNGQDYLADVGWAVEFAYNNRALMINEMLAATGLNSDVMQRINIHHNFVSLEDHGGKNLWVHRKGATQARVGQFGIIPGSMGTESFIVRGLGNEIAMSSCSHGAGRRMSRTAARKEITQEAFDSSMAGTYTTASSKLLDEAPGAYKDVREVMSYQTDLVEIVHTLKPIITIKGEGNDN